jgi:hypothetical protein
MSSSTATDSTTDSATVTIVGALKNIHREGDASPRVALSDVLKPHIYAIGPVAYLQGEITIVDGRLVVSKVTDSGLRTHSSDTTRAALLAYGVVEEWHPFLTLQADTPLEELDRLISQSRQSREPMWIRVQCDVKNVNWHVIHWPLTEPIDKGNHKRHALYGSDTDSQMDIIGVHAPDGAGVITHHSTGLHLHAITERGEAVHIDDITLPAGTVIRYGTSSH